MRLIYTTNDKKKGQLLSNFLTSKAIENKLEIGTVTDWGSANYGDVHCKIWVIDEDKTDSALGWIDSYESDPSNPIFENTPSQLFIPAVSTPIIETKTSGSAQRPAAGMTMSVFAQRNITFYLIVLCSLLFFIDTMTEPQITSLPATSLPSTPLMASPIKKAVLYDYPKAYEILDKLANLYGIDKLHNPEDLPTDGQVILNEFYKTPYWHGAYIDIVDKYEHPEGEVSPNKGALLFEKIRQGEIWRTFTPALMHNDILHLLFNMLWLIVLGQQMEQRLGARRYLFFALLVGIFSNTCQYLMSGPNFIGYSGVLCGMLTFIWVRQKIAAWEGYPLQKSTFTFMMFFIFTMVAIQLTSIYFEVFHQISIAPGIANTAHLSGAAFGAILGCLPFFSWKG